jgi:hypothetical protein
LYGLVGNDPISFVDAFGLAEVAPVEKPITHPTNPKTPGINIPGWVVILWQAAAVSDRINEINEYLDDVQRDIEADAPTEPQWGDPDIKKMISNGLGGGLCAEIAMRKPGINQYVYSPTSLNRSLGAFAVLWHPQQGEDPRVFTPGYKAANGVSGQKGTAHRAHLIANRFGGDGDFHNLATTGRSFNLSSFETLLNNKIDEELKDGCFVCVFVVPIYLNKKPVPSSFVFGIVNQQDKIVEFGSHAAPKLRGDLRLDPEPWKRFSRGRIENLNSLEEP